MAGTGLGNVVVKWTGRDLAGRGGSVGELSHWSIRDTAGSGEAFSSCGLELPQAHLG